MQVNLLTRSMALEAEDELSEESIIAAVTAAGYGASLATGGAVADTSRADEARAIRNRLLGSLVFLLPLVLVCHLGEGLWAKLLCWALVLPIVVLNCAFFRRGAKGLLTGAPNMDTLIALGATAAMVSGAADGILMHGGMAYVESAGMILTLITLGKWLEARATGETGSALRELRALLPDRACVLRGEAQAEIAAAELVVGDVLLVRPGERVAADGEVLEGVSSMDESAFTGESLPVAKSAGCKVCAGMVNGNGALRVRVEKLRGECALSGIIELVGEAAAGKAPIARLADRVSGVFVPCVLLLAALTAAVWRCCGADWETAAGFAIAVLVISCPCALGLATPVAIMAGAGRGAERGLLFRNGSVLESARRVDTVLLDKTGTVTEGKPVVTDILPAAGETETSLLALAAGLETGSNHPLAGAITAAAQERGSIALAAEQSHYHAGRGVSALLGGVPCAAGNAVFMQELGVAAEEGLAERLAAQGKTPLFFARGTECAGVIAVADPVRPSSAAAVRALRAEGLRVLMVTGDNARTAAAVAAQAGIDEVTSGALPQDKAAKVRELQAAGHCVAVVGDGINDAPALTAADVGIAIGAGTDVALESAGIILLRSELTDVVAVLRLSRAVIRTIRQNLFWAFFYNALAIPLAAGVYVPLFGWQLSPPVAAAAMSLSSFCVVTNALRLKQLSLFTEPTDKMMNTITIHVEGMMCPHCEKHMTDAMLALPNVTACTASHKEKRVVLTVSAPVETALLEQTVTKAGYTFGGLC